MGRRRGGRRNPTMGSVAAKRWQRLTDSLPAAGDRGCADQETIGSDGSDRQGIAVESTTAHGSVLLSASAVSARKFDQSEDSHILQEIFGAAECADLPAWASKVAAPSTNEISQTTSNGSGAEALTTDLDAAMGLTESIYLLGKVQADDKGTKRSTSARTSGT